jgi:polyisoprenoid-binding protein YceI
MSQANHDASLPSWIVDPMHTTVMFSVRHLMITNVHGVFEAVRGTVRYDARRPERSELDIEIPAASIATRQPQRDAHLRGPDFFDVEAHPTVRFRSTRIGVSGGRVYEIAGALTIRGATRELVLAVDEVSGEQRDHNGKLRIGASAHGRLLRSEYGMTYNRVLEAGGLAVSDEVKLRFELSLLQDEASA